MPLFAPHIITPDSALGGIQLEKSLRFNSGDTAYLERTPSSASNRKTFTWSSWIKLSSADNVSIFSVGTSVTNRTFINTNSNRIHVFNEVGDSINLNLLTTALLRDFTSWYHLVVAVDSTQATASNRVKIYLNNTQLTDFDTETYFSQNSDTFVSNNQVHRIGNVSWTNSNLFNGYMTEINFIDGNAYDPSYFGFTDAQTGQWRPKKYGGTYGTTGFHLDFSDNSSTAALGIDKSGNGNNFTPNNFSVTAGVTNDSFEDTPTNNFATMNPLNRGVDNPTCTNGNLYFGGSTDHTVVATFAIPSSGKWYWEYTKTTGTYLMSGIIGDPEKAYLGTSTYLGGQANGYSVYASNGQTYAAGSNATYMATPSTSTTIMIAFDADNRRLYFGADGNWGDGSGNTNQTFANAAIAHTVTAGITYLPAGSFNSGSAFANFGQRAFSYTPPTGYRALNSKNIATPSASAIIKPQRHFDTLIWDGNSTQDRNITGLEFKPDFVWIKSRNGGTYGGGLYYHHMIWDVLRGVGSNTIGASSRKELTVNQSYEEGRGANYTDYYGHVSSFNKDGFQLDHVTGEPPLYVNRNTNTYVGWCWKAGGAGVSNSDGSITSTVSANTEAGFSIVTYAGSGSNATIGHGLDEAPQVLFVKTRTSADHWAIYHRSVGNTKILYLNLTNSPATSSNYWNNTTPTSTVFSIGNDNKTGKSGDNYVAYCWHEVPGYSKFGSYTGNGSANGPFIHLGFRPAWFLQKKTSGTGGWYLFDNKRSGFNVDNDMLVPNETDAEYDGDTYPRLDFLSNGIKWRDAGSSVHNAANATYVYMAFAESPTETIFGLDANAR